MHGEKWTITTRKKMFKEAQKYFTSHNPNKISLVDELLAERHQLATESNREIGVATVLKAHN